jgi:hypothetical protein
MRNVRPAICHVAFVLGQFAAVWLYVVAHKDPPVQQKASRFHKTYQTVALMGCIGVLAHAWSQTTPR